MVPPQWIVPQWPAPPRVRALSTTRHGGVSQGSYSSFNVGASAGDEPASVAANRALLRALLPAEPRWLRQVHGARVVDAAALADNELAEADASLTRIPGVVLAIQAADCMPVLLVARDGSVIAAAHAGWRGLAGGVIENTVRGMGVAAEEVVAWLGPAIGARSYEVGEDVRQAFLAEDAQAASAFTAGEQPGKHWLDLYAVARQRLERLGVTAVHGGDFCTLRDSGRFFSYRRDGATGRMATLIWLEP